MMIKGVWVNNITCPSCKYRHPAEMSCTEARENYLGTLAPVPDFLSNAPTLQALANGADEGETKPSNPKDVIGSRKLDMGNVPDTAVVGLAEALTEGAVKYGRYNWRIAGVRASIYHAAIRRHLAKWWNGEDVDRDTLVHHLKSSMACHAILLDALAYDTLTDDRPPSPYRGVVPELIAAGEGSVAHLRELFKDCAPYQFTIADTPKEI